MTNCSAHIRKDDGKVVITTDAYVSHRKAVGPWPSSFSLTVDEAKQLVRDIEAATASQTT